MNLQGRRSGIKIKIEMILKRLFLVTNSLTNIPVAMSLKGKTAVITGGTRGIGLATAHNFLKEGVVVSLGNHLIQL